ncbi:penicillin acylase family protein [Chitinophaga japonensis]|uniref:Penicillin amidase n=1 Tax=Chitinophaga japonensis TaxID=104662 RepID=A0A562SL64_CHIJA|nr:penicillin acylase family protein [Chitinophaga japonensis]TWI81948.1 penicillin amidase [Chitinophaga japonensis]
MKRFLGVLLLVLLAAAWLYLTNYHFHGLGSLQQLADYRKGILGKEALPENSGTVLAGPAGAATIDIDTLGIPHIFGSNANALAYAAGYMHARDRYFQMELLAFAVMGRLSEIIGADGIYSDQNWKRFDLEERARRLLDTLALTQPDLFSYLNAYALGVNAYISREDDAHRDPMYLIWNYQPGAWKPYYSFLVQWYMSFDLTFYDDYFDRQEILDKLPPAVRSILYPDRPDKPSFIIPGQAEPTLQGTRGNMLAECFKPHIPSVGYAARPTNRSLGSNNWVVGATHTESGQLFLCNDLHLFLTNPGIFYEMQLKCPGMHVYGYTIPGVPLVLTGHNERIAWGITNGGWDVTEQYLLRLNPSNKGQYWLDGKWADMDTRHYAIHVKGQSPQHIQVRYTVFGPVVERDSLVYALRWHPAQGGHAIQAFWKLGKAGNWPGFREALRGYDYPSQNFVYGDIQGNIGMICAGSMPVKPPGYAGGLLDGRVSPLRQYVPFDALPMSYNPDRNYLFSANQEPVNGDYYYAARWFADLYRPSRINNILSAGKHFSREDMRQMQLDVTDLSVQDLHTLLDKYAHPAVLSANWQAIRQWEGRIDATKKEAAFYKAFREAAGISSRRLATSLDVRSPPSFDQFMHFLLCNDSLTYKERPITPRKCFLELMALTDSVYAAGKHAGAAYAFSIPQFTFLPGLDIRVEGLGGNDNTINVNHGAHPVIRTIIELKGTGIRSWMVNAIGQTGRLNEKNYTQQLASWKENQVHPTRFVTSPGDLEGITERIIFSPKE